MKLTPLNMSNSWVESMSSSQAVDSGCDMSLRCHFGDSVSFFGFCKLSFLSQAPHLNASEPGSQMAELASSAIPFDDHFGDSYHRVQRVRAKKVTAWLGKADTFPTLVISSCLIAPVERIMPDAYIQGLRAVVCNEFHTYCH